MAEEFQEKTERATPRKRQKAKEKGQVARSRDLTSMVAMGGIVLMLYFGGGYFITKLAEMTGSILTMQFGTDLGETSRMALMQAAYILIPLFMTTVTLVTVSSVMQGGFVLKPVKIELDKVNPLNGIKRIFSFRGLTEFLKSLLKFAAGSWVVYYVISRDLDDLPRLSAMELHDMLRTSGKLVMHAIAVAFFYYLLVAVVSYFIERWQHERSLRMTKQEVKQEHKDLEGDPLIKSRIRSLQREMARNRMMQEVPTATVVVTNPQHLAVALRYEDRKMTAPRVVAKGAGVVAAKIREIAVSHNVPLVEDKPLARALYKLELNSFIPEELYVAVAKILAYIYKLRGEA